MVLNKSSIHCISSFSFCYITKFIKHFFSTVHSKAFDYCSNSVQKTTDSASVHFLMAFMGVDKNAHVVFD